MSYRNNITGLDADLKHAAGCKNRFARRSITRNATGVLMKGPHVQLPRNATNRARPMRRSKAVPRKHRRQIWIRNFIGADSFDSDVDSGEDVRTGRGLKPSSDTFAFASNLTIIDVAESGGATRRSGSGEGSDDSSSRSCDGDNEGKETVPDAGNRQNDKPSALNAFATYVADTVISWKAAGLRKLQRLCFTLYLSCTKPGW